MTLALLLIFDTFVMYWIFTAIVDTRRTLRLRKNYVKLSMYNHFAYTLIFAIVASLGFVVWALVTLNFPSGGCLTVSACFVCVLVCEYVCVLKEGRERVNGGEREGGGGVREKPCPLEASLQ
ncbi:MAG: lung seven transmembrane receptor family protein [Proteobacteria bacterium]|nr:lung seven transmembrane receptor family protein [Pseudomonadota bacterium]